MDYAIPASFWLVAHRFMLAVRGIVHACFCHHPAWGYRANT